MSDYVEIMLDNTEAHIILEALIEYKFFLKERMPGVVVTDKRKELEEHVQILLDDFKYYAQGRYPPDVL